MRRILAQMEEDAESVADEIPSLDDQQRHQVVEVMMTTVVCVWRRMIDQGSPTHVQRDAVAKMAMKWPLLCTSSASIARLDHSYPAMLFYERVRLGLCDADYFFDGVPKRLPIFGAPIKLEFPAQQMADLMFEHVVGDRASTIEKLESATPGSTKRTKLTDTLDGLPDVCTDVPVPARLFLSRVRSMCHGLRQAQPEANFRQCANNRCCRIFYNGNRQAGERINMASELSDVVMPYWQSCSSGPPQYDGPNCMRFCSDLCCKQWHADWHRIMPDYNVEWDADARIKTRADRRDARVATAFERAISRNAKATRVLKKRRKKVRSNGSALSPTDVAREFDARVHMLNVDTGLLYAASIFSRLPCRRGTLTLPGEFAGWRDNGDTAHRNAILRVAQIYRQHAQREPVYDLLTSPTFLRAVKSHVIDIF